MISKDKIQTLLDEKLAEGDFFLVDLKVSADNKISIFVDSESSVKLEDCIAISRHIEGNLDREEEDFELEVSSAGIGLPFKVYKQYEKNLGEIVEVLCNDGRKLEGELKSVDENGFCIEYEQKVKVEGKKRKVLQTFLDTVAFADVKSTKLVLKL